ncbi:DUF6268 family outer membrane beta-barrel protein [Ferrimonas senticii]|uniref:DUF6268 family outer membrane beta-barrel protein n=1 Tax=Ferrimonas senticii TaxID=394566 RepID=UPI00040EC8B6|nr:DUF6268 family outer membrane beta-barrel protein [Ferrimonas senticii]
MKAIAALLLASTATAVAAQPHYAQGDFNLWALKVYGVSGSESDVERGGKLKEHAVGGSLQYMTPIGHGRMLGGGIEIDKRTLDFSGATGLPAALGQLNERLRYQAAIAYIQPLNKEWSMMLSPAINWSYADEASAADGFGYSLVAITNYSGFEGMKLGFGLAYSDGPAEDNIAPFISIDWQINDKWRLSSPFDAGFNGKAGLELSYQYSPSITVGAGAGLRTDQFAVDANTAIQQDMPVGYVRASYNWSPQATVSLLMGFRSAADLTVYQNGNETDYEIDASGLFGLSMDYKF